MIPDGGESVVRKNPSDSDGESPHGDGLRGRFITFEGIDGGGKTTQVHALAENLRAVGLSVLETREPGGTAVAELARRLIKQGKIERFGPFAEAIVFAAARDDHLTLLIRPALEEGTWVICDRFSDSTRAYQGVCGGVDASILARMEEITIGDARPDLTFIIDVSPDTALERIRLRNEEALNRGEQNSLSSDYFEEKMISRRRQLREAFLSIAKMDSARCVVIDGNAHDPAHIARQIWRTVVLRFGIDDRSDRRIGIDDRSDCRINIDDRSDRQMEDL